MVFDLSFWRFVIIVSFAKSLLWGKDEDTYLFHVGTFTNKTKSKTAIKIIILPISICIGFADK